VEKLLPLFVIVPLAAAFLIPMVNLLLRRGGASASGAMALVATALLAAISVALFASPVTLRTWVGNWRGDRSTLGLTGGGDGTLVTAVAHSSEAEKAGIMAGDRLIRFRIRAKRGWTGVSWEPVRSIRQLRRLNAAYCQATLPAQMDLVVERGGETRNVSVNLGKTVTGIAMVCDGLSKLLLVIISLVAFTSVLFSMSYMKGYTKLHLYYSPLMLMIAGMNGVVLSGDLFNIYVFMEVAAVASYALVGFGVESEEIEASFKYLVLSAVASGFILFGIGIVYSLSGTLNLAQIADFTLRIPENRALWLAMAFFISGFGLKAAMVPFHAWLPDAHPSAPAPISAMLSGVLIKAAGVYVIARLVFNVMGVSMAVGQLMIILGTLSLLVGGFLMWGQSDLKRLLAYSSISHMGLVMLALGVAAEALAGRDAITPRWHTLATLAAFAALFHLLNHGAFKSLLFLISGSIEHGTGERDMNLVGGVGRAMPWTGLFARIGSLSIAGVPPFNGFFSKLLILIAVAWSGHWFVAGLVVVGSLLTLLTFIKVQRNLLEEKASERLGEVKESPLSMQVAMAILAVLCIGLGLLLPLYGGGVLKPAARALTGQLSGYATSVFGG